MDLQLTNWAALCLSLLILIGYEMWLHQRTSRSPQVIARSAHSLLRQHWVQALSGHIGSEVLAVQALRNSLMSSTITASTAAVMLMGGMSLTLSNSQIMSLLMGQAQDHGQAVRLAVMALMLATLFATYVCSALSMRYFNHAGFAMSLPVGSTERLRYQPMCLLYMNRGGLLYGWGLRCFLYMAPLLTGLFAPWLMPLAAIVLVWILLIFDQAGPMGDEAQ